MGAGDRTGGNAALPDVCRTSPFPEGPTMQDATRRDFLKQTSALLAGAAALSSAGATARGAEDAQPAAQSVPASSTDKVRLGFVGPNGRGASLLQMFMGFEDAEIIHL